MKKKSKTKVSAGSPNKSTVGIKPLGDRVLLKELKTTKDRTDSGIYIPETVKEDRGAKRGEVVAVGPGHFNDGKLVPVGVKVGDKVLYQWGEEVTLDGVEYTLVREGEIIAITK